MNLPIEQPGIEHSFLSRKLETGGGSAFRASPELQELQERYLGAKTERQNMSMAASCFAMACPIMPLGFLATLFVLGKLDGMDKDPLSMASPRTLSGDMARITATEALMRKKRDNGEDPESDAYIRYASRELQLRPLRTAMQPIRGSEKRVIPKQQQSRDTLSAAGYFLTREKMTKERESKRQKILLGSLADKERTQQNNSESNKLSEKLERLDKLLKQMGV